MSNSVKDMLESAIKNMDALIDTKKIIGEPITAADGTVILPVTNVSVGFGGGGSEFSAKNIQDKNFGGGMGGGIKLTPEAFLVINNNNVRLIPVKSGNSPLDKVIDLVPDMVDKVNGFFKKDNKEEE